MRNPGTLKASGSDSSVQPIPTQPLTGSPCSPSISVPVHNLRLLVKSTFSVNQSLRRLHPVPITHVTGTSGAGNRLTREQFETRKDESPDRTLCLSEIAVCRALCKSSSG
ncbi:hypothetical protein NMG60_11016548 [Bertholletia excelsa]